MCWAKIRKYLAVARELKCTDELTLAPLVELPTLVQTLKEQRSLVAAARGHVDMAFRKAMKEDTCGECTCEGSRRRRAHALGMWIAPSLMKRNGAHSRKCEVCEKPTFEKSEQVLCQCCEKSFHMQCVNHYHHDFVCSKCVPKFKRESNTTKSVENEED